MNTNGAQQLELLDIYDVWYNPWWQQTWFLSLCILAGMGFLAVVGYSIYKKFFVRLVDKPVWQRIVDELKVLEKSDFHDQKNFYSQLTSLLKEAIEDRYKLKVVDKTDDEFISILETSHLIPIHIVQQLKVIFEGVVLIKFAQQKTVQEHMACSLKTAQVVVIEMQKNHQKTD